MDCTHHTGPNRAFSLPVSPLIDNKCGSFKKARATADNTSCPTPSVWLNSQIKVDYEYLSELVK